MAAPGGPRELVSSSARRVDAQNSARPFLHAHAASTRAHSVPPSIDHTCTPPCWFSSLWTQKTPPEAGSRTRLGEKELPAAPARTKCRFSVELLVSAGKLGVPNWPTKRPPAVKWRNWFASQPSHPSFCASSQQAWWQPGGSR